MKFRLSIYVLLISLNFFSQKMSFVYDVKYRLNTKKPNDVNRSSMILDIDADQSIFREEIDKKADSLQQNNKKGMYPNGVENQFYVKKNLKKYEIQKIITNSTINYLLPIDDKLEWKILSDQKNIGKYKSQKAETSYGGRIWNAWFTTELPFSDGPYIFNGLPGLIISISDSNNDYSFELIEVKKLDKLFDVRSKLIKIDWKKYDYIARSYFNDPLDVNSKIGKTVTFTDAQGKKVEISDVNKSMQETILNDNNPLELNHKVNY